MVDLLELFQLADNYMDDSEVYEVLPLSVNIFNQIETSADEIKPFIAVYFPADLLSQMNWTKKTPLIVTIDGSNLIISKKELQYEYEPEPEPTYI
ncbi:MAG TPA: hypothetical protein PKY59_12185 [Pyrinomonadaceae bacterium]|nr:hypothetical protein [Pyrinomonadaceae bacterium]